MTKTQNAVLAFIMQLASLIIAYTLFAEFTFFLFQDVYPGLLWPWLILSLAGSYLFRLFMRKERSLPTVLIFQTLLLAVQMVVFYFWLSGLFLVLLLMSAILCNVVQAKLCLTSLQRKYSRHLFEFSVIFLAISLWLSSALGYDLRYNLPLVFTVLLVFFTMVFLHLAGGAGRAAGMTGRQGVTLLIIVLLVAGAFIFAFNNYLAEPIGAGLDSTVNSFWGGVQSVWGSYSNAIERLASLLPGPKENTGFDENGDFANEALLNEAASIINPDENNEPVEISPYFVIGLVALFGLFILIALSFMLFQNRKTMLRTYNNATTPDAPGEKRIAVSFGKALLLAFQTLSRYLLFWLHYFFHRNTPEGVFILMERLAARRLNGRNKGETPRQFINRISVKYKEEADLLLLLSKLADALDNQFFAPKQKQQLLSRNESRILRSHILSRRYGFKRYKKQQRLKQSEV